MIMIAQEIPPVRYLNWDIRLNGSRCWSLVLLARADCGMDIPLQSAPSRNLLGDRVNGNLANQKSQQ